MQDKCSLNDIIQLQFPAQLKTGCKDHYSAQGSDQCNTEIGALYCLNLHNRKDAIFDRLKAEYTTQDSEFTVLYKLSVAILAEVEVNLLQKWNINELQMLVYKQKRPQLTIQMMLFIYAVNTICSNPHQFKKYYQPHFTRPYDYQPQQREQEKEEEQLSKQDEPENEQEELGFNQFYAQVQNVYNAVSRNMQSSQLIMTESLKTAQVLVKRPQFTRQRPMNVNKKTYASLSFQGVIDKQLNSNQLQNIEPFCLFNIKQEISSTDD